MPRYLMFHVYGPMQSWGGIAVGEVRGTDRYPSKSGVLGLVAAALGIPREREQALRELDERLAMAVRIDAPGALLRDYHTTQVPSSGRGKVWRTRRDELAEPKLNTILSTRDYRADAVFSVALWAPDPDNGPIDLDAIARAFAKPRFQLYLGRKSCPIALPILPDIFQAPNLEAAFAMALVPEPLAKLCREPEREVFYDPVAHTPPPVFTATRRDGLRSRVNWTFDPREESQAFLRPATQPERHTSSDSGEA